MYTSSGITSYDITKVRVKTKYKYKEHNPKVQTRITMIKFKLCALDVYYNYGIHAYFK